MGGLFLDQHSSRNDICISSFSRSFLGPPDFLLHFRIFFYEEKLSGSFWEPPDFLETSGFLKNIRIFWGHPDLGVPLDLFGLNSGSFRPSGFFLGTSGFFPWISLCFREHPDLFLNIRIFSKNIRIFWEHPDLGVPLDLYMV